MSDESDTQRPRNDTVLRRDVGDVCLITLNRPERNNGWTLELEERYFELLIDAAADPAVRAIVITGAGRAFCAGADPETLRSVASGAAFSTRGRVPQIFTRHVPKPVIAAINGACAGVGLVQALLSDVRFMARSARLSTAFSRRGLPAENAVAWLLPRLVGDGVAADLLLSGRAVSADEAAALGVVNHAVDAEDLLPTALAYAQDMAGRCSPRAMADIKRALQQAATMTLEEAFLASRRTFDEVGDHPDVKEGMLSFVERRRPVFAPLSVALDAEGARS